ncbi:MAG: hypothetical protein ACQEWI_07075 [Bacillota bacterium]
MFGGFFCNQFQAALATMAMQNGIDGSEDFDSSVGALNANTEDLSAAKCLIF